MTTKVFWGDDEGPVVMVWDGMTQEEQVIARFPLRALPFVHSVLKAKIRGAPTVV